MKKLSWLKRTGRDEELSPLPLSSVGNVLMNILSEMEKPLSEINTILQKPDNIHIASRNMDYFNSVNDVVETIKNGKPRKITPKESKQLLHLAYHLEQLLSQPNMGKQLSIILKPHIKEVRQIVNNRNYEIVAPQAVEHHNAAYEAAKAAAKGGGMQH